MDNIPNFNTSQVKNFRELFNTQKLQRIDLSEGKNNSLKRKKKQPLIIAKNKFERKKDSQSQEPN